MSHTGCIGSEILEGELSEDAAYSSFSHTLIRPDPLDTKGTTHKMADTEYQEHGEGDQKSLPVTKSKHCGGRGVAPALRPRKRQEISRVYFNFFIT